MNYPAYDTSQRELDYPCERKIHIGLSGWTKDCIQSPQRLGHLMHGSKGRTHVSSVDRL